MKKKVIKVIVLGGLMLSAPFAVFAFGGNSNAFEGKSFVEFDSERIAAHDAMSDLRVEHMNELIDALPEGDANTERLKELLTEYIDLEASIKELNLTDIQAQELRDVFFEYRTEERTIGKEFRDLIEESLTQEELNTFGEEFRADNEALRVELGLPEMGHHMRNSFDDLTFEQRETINQEMGWSDMPMSGHHGFHR